MGLIGGAGLALDRGGVPEGPGGRAHRYCVVDFVHALGNSGVVDFARGTSYLRTVVSG